MNDANRWGVQYRVYAGGKWGEWVGPVGIYCFKEIVKCLGVYAKYFEGQPILFPTRHMARELIVGKSGPTAHYRVINATEKPKEN